MYLNGSTLLVDSIITTDPVFLDWLVDTYGGRIAEEPSITSAIQICDEFSEEEIVRKKIVVRNQISLALAAKAAKVYVFEYDKPYDENDSTYTVERMKAKMAKLRAFCVVEFAPISIYVPSDNFVG
jgi:hypothetical protein